MNKTTVLIVDDSALVREILTRMISSDPELEVVGSAADPLIAQRYIDEKKPHVITLDIHMPRMDGLTFLEKLMAIDPIPVILVSTLSVSGAEITLRGLSLGAVDFVTKPRSDIESGLSNLRDEIITKIKAAARSRPRVLPPFQRPSKIVKNHARKEPSREFRLIAIGGSTGGPEALQRVLTELPENAPGVVAALHMPPGFTTAYAARLNQCCQMRVQEAKDGDKVEAGSVLISPGDRHLVVNRQSEGFVVSVTESERVNRHRPSVDVLFTSVANSAGPKAIGVILTGMGVDGAEGLLQMRRAGAMTFAQDESSCVVYGMPRAAVEKNAACGVLALGKIPAAITQAYSSNLSGSRSSIT